MKKQLLEERARLRFSKDTHKLDEINKQLKPYEDQYLQDLLDIAMKELRKKAFPYSRHPFMYHEIKIVWTDMERDKVAGYVQLEDLMNDEVVIYINEKYLYRYDRCPNELTTSNRRVMQRSINKNLISIIKHEIIHAFVYFKYDSIMFKDVMLGFFHDSSPIFMAYLLWLNPEETNGYDCFEEFKKTDFYEKVMSCKKFDEVMTLCILKAQTLAKEVRLHSTLKDTDNKKLIQILPSFPYAGKWNEDMVLRRKIENTIDGVETKLYFVDLNNLCDRDYKYQVKFLLEDESILSH